MAEKTKGQEMLESLSYQKQNYYEAADEQERAAIYAYAEGYKAFLNAAKTEREACAVAVKMAEEKGFTRYELGDKLKKGDKKYFVNRGKSVVVFRIGSKNPEEDGLRIIAFHIDAPCIDIKQNPLFEREINA